jgi:hypothetical protein
VQTVANLQLALAKRTEVILSKEADPELAMKAIEASAESGGLVTEATHLETDSPENFARYLWVENPLAVSWLNDRQENMRNPLTVSDLSDLQDVLGS